MKNSLSYMDEDDYVSYWIKQGVNLDNKTYFSWTSILEQEDSSFLTTCGVPLHQHMSLGISMSVPTMMKTCGRDVLCVGEGWAGTMIFDSVQRSVLFLSKFQSAVHVVASTIKNYLLISTCMSKFCSDLDTPTTYLHRYSEYYSQDLANNELDKMFDWFRRLEPDFDSNWEDSARELRYYV